VKIVSEATDIITQISAQQAYDESHRVFWDGARILEIESNSRHRKCNELAQIACFKNPIRESSLDISPTWISLIGNEITKCMGSP
jgi:hypothetical protein